MLKKLKNFKLQNLLVILILGTASFFRFFKLKELLGFWYDQGRDALVIWDLIYNHKLTLIGPQMGFTGIFRGGWYYWLIAPFYALGKGNPIYPSVFLVLTTIAAIYFIYVVGKRMEKPYAGILAAFIASVSMYIIGASRWLSDPTPTLLISVLLILSLFKMLDSKKWAIPLSFFLSGMALQFSAATEIFYVPALILLLIIFRKKIKPDFKTVIASIAAFIVPFSPQILFEIRHPGVQTSALFNFLFHEKTFTYAFWEIIKTRIPFDLNMIASKFWINGGMFFGPFLLLFIFLLIKNWKKLWISGQFKIVFTLAVAPLIGTMFFVSNLGGVYEYYFTGYYLIWILLFSYVYIFSWKSILVKIALPIFIFCVLFFNLKVYIKDYITNSDKTGVVTLSQEISAIDWIYKNTNNRDFNVDVYVPPVIPYAYDYLFRWLGTNRYSRFPQENQVALLYTLYEADTSHPERLQVWLARQEGIGIVLKEENFGSITVQERQRIIEQ